MTDCPNPDAREAALAMALDAIKESVSKGQMRRIAIQARANLSPAAKEILEKAQAHDRQAKLIRLLLPDSLLREVVEEWPTRAQREAAADELQRRAALAGKEPE